MKRRFPASVAAVSTLLVLAACGSESSSQNDAAICEQAAAHAQSCFPGRTIAPPTSCDPLEAQKVLASTCDELTVAEGKADGCIPWLWWTCTGGGSTSRVSFWVSLNVCYDDFCDVVHTGGKCALVTIEDADGNEVARKLTNGNGNAEFVDLELNDGTYAVKVVRNDESPGEMMVRADNDIQYSARGPAEQSIVVGEGDLPRVYFYLAQGEDLKLRRCAEVQGLLTSSCGSELQNRDEVQWQWMTRLRGNGFEELARAISMTEGNMYVYFDVPVGDHELAFLELDVPSSARVMNPDKAGLVSDYATGNEVTTPLTVTKADIGTVIRPDTVELASTQCP